MQISKNICFHDWQFLSVKVLVCAVMSDCMMEIARCPSKNGQIPKRVFLNVALEVVHLSCLWFTYDICLVYKQQSVFPAITASSKKPELICIRQNTPGYFPMTVISPRGMPPFCMNKQHLHFKISCTFNPKCRLAHFTFFLSTHLAWKTHNACANERETNEKGK